MKKYPWIIVALLITLTAYSQPNPPPAPGIPGAVPPGAPPPPNIERDSVNYLIRVEWRVPNGEPKFIEVLTTEGQFDLNTIEKNPVKINGNDVPTTLKFSGSINAVGG